MPDGDYKYLLVYHDHGTRFCRLVPLKRKTASTVASALKDIFFLFAPPHPVNVLSEVDGWNMTCVIVMKVQGKGYLEVLKYCLAWNAGNFDQLYHCNYLEVVKNATPESKRLVEALACWMYLPLIKEREGQRSTSIVAKYGNVAESNG